MASMYKRGNVWWVHYLLEGQSDCRSLKTAHRREALQKKKQIEWELFLTNRPGKRVIPLPVILEASCRYVKGTQSRKSHEEFLRPMSELFGPICGSLRNGELLLDDTSMASPPDVLNTRDLWVEL